MNTLGLEIRYELEWLGIGCPRKSTLSAAPERLQMAGSCLMRDGLKVPLGDNYTAQRLSYRFTKADTHDDRSSFRRSSACRAANRRKRASSRCGLLNFRTRRCQRLCRVGPEPESSSKNEHSSHRQKHGIIARSSLN